MEPTVGLRQPLGVRKPRRDRSSPSRCRQPELIQDLLLGDLLRPPEHVDLGQIREAQLVQVHLRPERDEADEGVVGEEADGAAHGGFDEP